MILSWVKVGFIRDGCNQRQSAAGQRGFPKCVNTFINRLSVLVYLAPFFVIPSCRLTDELKCMKLGNITGMKQSFTFVCPSRTLYRLLIVKSGPADADPPSFKGSITIMEDKRTVIRFNTTSEKLREVGWANCFECHSYVMRWHNSSGESDDGDLSKYLKTGHSYSIQTDFTILPPKDTMVWLCWIH